VGGAKPPRSARPGEPSTARGAPPAGRAAADVMQRCRARSTGSIPAALSPDRQRPVAGAEPRNALYGQPDARCGAPPVAAVADVAPALPAPVASGAATVNGITPPSGW